jgi:hypothetical protein
MGETVVVLAALGLLITVYALIVYGVGWLIVATPLMKWLLYAVVGFLTLKVVLLPYDHLSIWWSGEYPDVAVEEEVLSKTETVVSTKIVPTRRSGKFTLLAQGSLTNKSDQVIESVSIWCRVPKLGFGDSETAQKAFPVVVHPGRTESFAGEIALNLTGVAVTGHHELQAPAQHFCRMEQVRTGR